MRQVYQHAGRVAAALVLVILVSATAVAAERDRVRSVPDGWQRAKQWVITVFARLGKPPGGPVEEETENEILAANEAGMRPGGRP